VTQHYEDHFRGSGLRATQFTILSTLAQTGPLPLSRLARFMGLERTTLTRNLSPLKQRNLVTLAGAPDARVREVAITPAGEALARKLLPRWHKAQETVGEVLNELGLPASGVP
jgi:DNA-binding MarR family transcriptional regulator